jgi:GNAT superfamily N-acetyltransferase
LTRTAARNFSPRQRSKFVGLVIRAPIKKIRRRRDAAELAVEQADDERVLTSLLEASPFPSCSLDQLGNCWLVAYLGDQPVGALCLATELDSALIRLFFVLAAHRRRKIGTTLLAAARAAARTRGVRTMYMRTSAIPEFLHISGFVPAHLSPNSFRPDDRACSSANETSQVWELDISQDGIILR